MVETKRSEPPSPGSGDLLLDLRGLLCPLPVVKTSAQLTGMRPGQLLEVLADDQGVKADFPALCASTGHEWLGYRQEGRVVRSFLRRKQG
ncbi:MAG: sulfurtransferase TusA family protein [Acidobacteriota bacterium]